MSQTGCGVKRNRLGVNSGGQEWFPWWFLTPDLLNLGCFAALQSSRDIKQERLGA